MQEEEQIDAAEETAAVEEALSSLSDPEPKEVTDEDVVSALLDKGIASKDKITHALAIKLMGDLAYTHKAET